MLKFPVMTSVIVSLTHAYILQTPRTTAKKFGSAVFRVKKRDTYSFLKKRYVHENWAMKKLIGCVMLFAGHL